MKKLCFLALVFVLISPFVVAGISVSEPLEIYNLGDRLYVNADGIVGVEGKNLDFNLVCGNETTILARLPAMIFSDEEESSWNFYKILTKEGLSINNFSKVVGECQVVVSLGADTSSTNSFVISDDVRVSVSLDKSSYNPGEAITVYVDAVKENGELLDGFVEGSNVTSFSKAIEDGSVSEVFTTPKTMEAGNYYLTIKAYDKGKEGILNEGVSGVGFSINQIASSLVLSLDNNVATPGSSFGVGAEVYDQSGIEMEGSVNVKFVSPDAQEFGIVVPAGDFAEMDFDSNATAGIWRVINSFGGIIKEKEFEMESVQKAIFDFEDDVLIIKNVGNTVYNRTINVNIGNESVALELNIGLGEVRKFSLEAPSGEYDVIVDDGVESVSRQVLLTGKAISIDDLKDVGIFRGYSVVWIFLIIVLGGIGFILFRRYRKTKVIGPHDSKPKEKKFGFLNRRGKRRKGFRANFNNSLNFTKKSAKAQGIDDGGYDYEDKTMVDYTKKGVGSAESSLVMKGEKSVSAIVALSVKNYDGLNDSSKKMLHGIIDKVRDMKGLIDWRGDYVFVVFSPIATKTYKNEVLAARAGMMILKELNIYNKKFKDKIEFGVGVHVGELVASKEKDKLKYTSIGNTVSLAKRIADSGSKSLLVSEEIRKKLLRDLKVSKGKEVGGKQTYEVQEVRDRKADEARLKDLLKRQGK